MIYISFIIFIVISIELIVEDFHYSKQCTLVSSLEYDYLNNSTKQKLCENYTDVIPFSYPSLHLSPNQNFENLKINNHGFRGSDFDAQKEIGIYRIFVVGSEAIFGFSATSDETTIPGFLQKKFNENNFKNVEVINAGIPSAFSLSERDLIKNNLIKFEPDLIIIYDGVSDLNRSYSTHINFNQYEKGIFTQTLESLQKTFPSYKTFKMLPKFIHFFSLPAAQSSNNNLENLNNDKTSIQNNYLSEKVSLWNERWDEICDLGITNDFETFIILQPFLGTGNRTLYYYEQNELDIRFKVAPTEFESYKEYANELEKIMNCKLTLDHRNIFDNTVGPIYMPYDATQFGDKGNEIIANDIFEKIQMTK